MPYDYPDTDENDYEEAAYWRDHHDEDDDETDDGPDVDIHDPAHERDAPPQDTADRWDDPDTNDGIVFADEREYAGD